jgi:hypothetical protein
MVPPRLKICRTEAHSLNALHGSTPMRGSMQARAAASATSRHECCARNQSPEAIR